MGHNTFFDMHLKASPPQRDSWRKVATSLALILTTLLVFASAPALALNRVNTVAGTYGTPGSTGDGGQALNALLRNPTGVWIMPNDDVIVSDFGNARVRRISTNGVISAIAGTGVAGFSGDGGLAINAQLRAPMSTLVDTAGDIYIADFADHRIRKVTVATGIITTVAGNGAAGSSGDGGQATSAQLNQPVGLAIDAAGNLYFSERAGNRIRRVTPAGVISTFAGTGIAGYSGDGGAATSARLNAPAGLAFNDNGILFVADSANNRIRSVNPLGNIFPVAGTGAASFSGDGGPAQLAALNQPSGLRFDANGVLFIATLGDARIRAIDRNGLIHSFGGNGTATPVNNGSDAMSGAVNADLDLAFDSQGNVWFAASAGHAVRRITRPNPGDRASTLDIVGATNPANIPLPAPSDPWVAARHVAVGSDRSSYVIGAVHQQTGTTPGGQPVMDGPLNWRILKYGALVGEALMNQTPGGWSQTYDSGLGDDLPYAIAVDASNNPVVVGVGRHSNGERQWRVHKYAASNGALMWAQSLNTMQYTTPTLLAVDAMDNIIVGGVIRGGGGDDDWLVVKYTNNGTELWQRTIVGSGHDTPHGLAIDPATRDVIIVGSMGTPTGSEFASARLASATGNVLWQQSFSTPDGHAVAYSVAIDGAGAIMIGGERAFAGQLLRPRVEKRAADGTQLWEYIGPDDRSAAFAMALAANGDIYVGGYRYMFSPFLESPQNVYLRAGNWLARLNNTTGSPQWVQAFFSGSHDTFIRDLKVGLDGHPIILSRQVGYPLSGPAPWPDVGWRVSKRYAENGDDIWSREVPSSGSLRVHRYVPGGMAINGDSVVATGTRYDQDFVGGAFPTKLHTVRFENPNQQFITFAALSNRSFSPTPFSVNPAGGLSGLPVLMSSLTPSICSAFGSNGTSITMLNAGVCTLRATQLGTVNWRAAAPVEQSFTISVAAQSINFAALPDKTFGDAAFTVSASGGASGNPVTFGVLTPIVCSTSGTNGTLVTLLSGGNCIIRASQAGNSAYAAAPDVDRSFTVALAAQTISFAALANKTFGDIPFTLTATGGASGNAVTFSSQSASICTTGSTNGATVTIIAAGTCTIRANQVGNSQYSAAIAVDRSFTVAKASQTITFNALADMTFGDAPSSLNATGGASGNAVTFTSLTSSICTATGSNGATLTLLIGSACTIRASQLGNANYDAAPNVDRSFTILRAPQTITFNAQSPSTRAYSPNGQFALNPSASASSTLAITYTTVDAAVCTIIAGNNVRIIGAGVCGITASQAGNGNYLAATAITQNVSITPAIQTITFGAAPTVVVGGTTSVTVTGGGSGSAIVLTSNTPSVCSIAGNTVTGLAAGVCILAANQAGNSNYQAATEATQNINVIRANQSISFGAAPSGGLAVNATLMVSATGGASTQPVVFSSLTATVCSSGGANGALITGLSMGLCTIAANQAGTSNYNAAPQVTQSFNVGIQLISVETPVFHIGSPRTLTASGGLSGNPIVFNSASPAICTTSGANGATLTRIAAGACVVTTNQAAGAGFAAASPVSITSYTPQREALGAGSLHTGAIHADGSLWMAGNNGSGQLGDGTLASRHVLTRIGSANNYTSIALGDHHTVALRTDGTLWRWGLGSGNAPMQDATASNWIAVATCDGCLGAIRADGSLWVWPDLHSAPTPIAGGPWIAITASVYEYLLIRADGTLWLLSRFDVLTPPTQVGTANTWTQVATMQSDDGSGNPLKFALKSDGTLWGWGYNNGQLGDGTYDTYSEPTQIGNGNDWVEVKTSLYATLARRSDGSFWAAGANNLGQLGLGHQMPSETFVPVGSVSDWDSIASGYLHSIARRADGTLWSWGHHHHGVLGDGTLTTRFTPLQSLQAPAIGMANAGAGIATVGFTALPATFNPVTGYRATSAPGGLMGSCTLPCSSISVNGLSGGISYTFIVAAINASGSGRESAVSNSVIPTAGPTRTVTPSAGANGTITPATPVVVNSGATSVLTVTPNSGYSASVGGTCGGSLVGTTYTTAAVTADCTVVASFSQNIALTGLVSRKTHGAAGTFDLPISTAHLIGGNVDVEPRTIGAGHSIVFQFNQAVTSIGSVTAVNASSNPIGVASAVINMSNTTEVVVTLTGIADASRVTVTLNGVNGSLSSAVSLGFLVGDVNNNRSVGNTDIAAMKTRIGLNVDSTNFKYDINASGTLTNTDVAAAKTRVGLGV